MPFEDPAAAFHAHQSALFNESHSPDAWRQHYAGMKQAFDAIGTTPKAHAPLSADSASKLAQAESTGMPSAEHLHEKYGITDLAPAHTEPGWGKADSDHEIYNHAVENKSVGAMKRLNLRIKAKQAVNSVNGKLHPSRKPFMESTNRELAANGDAVFEAYRRTHPGLALSKPKRLASAPFGQSE